MRDERGVGVVYSISTPTSPHTPQQSASKKPQPFLKSSFYVTFYALSVGAVDLKRRYARFSVMQFGFREQQRAFPIPPPSVRVRRAVNCTGRRDMRERKIISWREKNNLLREKKKACKNL